MKREEHPELRHVQRITECFDLVSQTAEYRFRICWEGARKLMMEKGFDPSRTIQLTCDHGDHVRATFTLPNGQAVSCDFREDSVTRQAVGLNSWKEIVVHPDYDVAYCLAAEILADPELSDAFDRAVLAFFDLHWRRDDKPLPSC